MTLEEKKIALQTAREAIKVMTDLANKYGYISEGESFSIADPNEVWYMELIGKGKDEKGAVWVALRVPDGYVSAHANQARITTFPYQKVKRIEKWFVVYFSSSSGVFVNSGWYGSMCLVVFGEYTLFCLASSITSSFVGGFLRNK